TGDVVAVHRLDLEPVALDTSGLWFTFSDELVEEAGMTASSLPGSLHALEHATIAMLPLFAICDRWDVGGVSTALQAQTAAPTVVIHDAHQGGSGIAELAFDAADELLAATLELIDDCRCDDGCPSRLQSPKCGNGNDPLDRAGARTRLATMRGEPVALAPVAAAGEPAGDGRAPSRARPGRARPAEPPAARAS